MRAIPWISTALPLITCDRGAEALHDNTFLQSAGRLSPLTLAFIGDGVFALLARCHVLEHNANMPVSKLHRLTVELVEARAQSRAYAILEPLLNEQESAVMRRGRNAHSPTVPRRADVVDYRRSTGVEALFGYLYLKDERERIDELFAAIVGEEEGEDACGTDI